MRLLVALAPLPWLLAGLAGCASGEGEGTLPGDSGTEPFSVIGADERLFFTGTEPFWGGHVEGRLLLYATPERPEGTAVDVERFAGRGGLSFSGTLAGRAFDLAATPGGCSDGMSDRTYPFTATLSIGDELRQGCGWTDRHPHSTPPQD